MEVRREGNQLVVGEDLRVDLVGGHTHFNLQALEVEYARKAWEFCEREGLSLPESFLEYEELAARATLTRVAEQNHNLDILSTREALRNLPEDPQIPTHYQEYYDREGNAYVMESYSFVGENRYADVLTVSFEDASAVVSRGSEDYRTVVVYPAEGPVQRPSQPDPDMDLWVRERKPLEVSWEMEP